jgi:signal transduction histidine kinase/CheY-like chemotaxis protein
MLVQAFEWLENPSRDQRALPEMVDRLFRFGGTGAAVPIVCLIGLSFLFAGRTGWEGPAVVVALHLLGAYALSDLTKRYAQTWRNAKVALSWARQHTLATAIKGMSWALGFWIWTPVATPGEIAILGTMAVSICTGSAMARACYLPCGLVHIAIVSCGFVIALALLGGGVMSMAIGGGALYLVWLAWVTFLVHRDSYHMVALAIQNAELISSLTDAQHAEAEAREAERQARLAAELARDDATLAHKAKSEFLAIVSHELRTPLNGILGMASVLNDTELTATQRDAIGTIRGAGEALSLIVDDLLDLTRLESGHTRLERQETSLPRLVESVVQILRLRAWEKRLSLSMDIASDVPEMLLCDAGRLRQILINLAGNAVKFTDRGGVQIRVTMPHGANSLRFEVADTGIGIPEDAIHRLFKPFSQVDQSYTRSYGGTGLGLAIVKRLATLMDGAVGVESQVGKGSTFWIEIPLLVPECNAKTDIGRAAVAAPENGPCVPLRVLVVDDSPQMRMMLKAVLAAANHTSIEAASGEEGLQELGRNAVDVVLLDLEMPGLDGSATARLIRAMPGCASVPIIALTGHDESVVESSGIAAAADLVLTKPVMPDILLPALQRFRPDQDRDRTAEPVEFFRASA